jgi:hypothetical protein
MTNLTSLAHVSRLLVIGGLAASNYGLHGREPHAGKTFYFRFAWRWDDNAEHESPQAGHERQTMKDKQREAAEAISPTPAPKKTWRDSYRKRMVNVRFPSVPAYYRVKRAASLEGDSVNSFIVDCVMKAADKILSRAEKQQQRAAAAEDVA